MPTNTRLINLQLPRAALAALLAIALLIPAPLRAQGYDLRVTLHDACGRGLAGVTITIRAEDGRELVRSISDGSGAASFAALPAVVRVAVAGQARGGPPLSQLGDDAQGVRLDLGQRRGAAILNLRAERDGLVRPDPATMLSLEEGGPLVADAAPFPTALLATPAPLPTGVAGTGVVRVGQAAQPADARRDGWMPLITMLVVALAAVLLRRVQRRRSAG